MSEWVCVVSILSYFLSLFGVFVKHLLETVLLGAESV